MPSSVPSPGDLSPSDLKIGAYYRPRDGCHPDAARLHTIRGEKGYAAEEKKLRAEIARWVNAQRYLCIELEHFQDGEIAKAVLRDEKTGKEFAMAALLLQRAT